MSHSLLFLLLTLHTLITLVVTAYNIDRAEKTPLPLRYYFPTTWSIEKRNSMQHYLASFTKATYPSSSLLETKEPQEDANPDTWSKAYALPFSGKNGAEAGGGSEPEVNSEWETNGENGGGSTNPKDKSCTKKTGMFLQGCVYVNNNQHLKTNKLHECQEQVSSIGAECVFGVRDEIGN